MHTEVYEVSTILGLCTVLAVLERNARVPGARRVLIVSINSRYPEVESWYRDDSRVQDAVRSKFDLVVELNEEIFPVHPSHWKYEAGWTGHRKRWSDLIGSRHVDVLYVESIQAPPSWSLAQLFSEAEIHVYSDGLMVYSPTRVQLPKDVLRRISELVYVDYLSGIEPLLLDEIRPSKTALTISELRPHFAALSSAPPQGVTEGGPAEVIFLGQAMANAKMMPHETEAALYVEGLSELAKTFGAENVVFKPHTSAPAALTSDVKVGFRAATGAELEVIEGRVPIESVIEPTRTAAVAGVFSTALFTTAQLFDVPAFTCGAKDVLYDLEPYENSNRIPLIAADILLPTLRSLIEACSARGHEPRHLIARDLADVSRRALREFRTAQIIVGYHMQPELLKHWKVEAERLTTEGEVRYLDLYLVGRKKAPSRKRGEPAATKPASSSQTQEPAGKVSKLIAETARFIARVTLDERKVQKLESDPERFFADSRTPGARLVGRAYRELVG